MLAFPRAALVNATQHPIMLYAPDGTTLLDTLPPSGAEIRLRATTTARGTAGGVPLAAVTYGDWYVVGDARKLDGAVAVVASMPVGEYFRTRGAPWHVLGVDGGAGAVRNAQGTIIGTRGLLLYATPDQ